MPQDKPSKPEEGRVFVFKVRESRLALCITFFILFFAAGLGIVVHEQLSGNGHSGTIDVYHAILLGAGEMPLAAAFLTLWIIAAANSVSALARLLARMWHRQ